MAHYLGQRLSSEGKTCTVRYVGDIFGTDGSWIGVEWDDPTRGKSGGIHGDHRYFKCRDSAPLAGSFLRPSRRFDKPVTFTNALWNKYRPETVNDGKIEISGKVVDEVGFDKIGQQMSNVATLKFLDLSHSRIAAQQTQRVLSDIESLDLIVGTLDLGSNLFETWPDLRAIAQKLKHLTCLRLQSNKLQRLASGTASGGHNSQGQDLHVKIEELVLDETLLLWDEVQLIALDVPNLKSLSFRNNDLQKIESAANLPCLTTLDLSNNLITHFDKIRVLTSLSTLVELNMSHNPIESLNEDNPCTFSSLQRLSLAGTLVSQNEHLAQFSHTFPNVRDLILTSTPGSSDQSSRLLTIGRISTLTKLNHSSISKEERSNAELFYLGSIINELKTDLTEASRTLILPKHPRFQSLWESYDRPPLPSLRPNQIPSPPPNTLSSRLLHLTFSINARLLTTLQALPPSSPHVHHRALIHRLSRPNDPEILAAISSLRAALSAPPTAQILSTTSQTAALIPPSTTLTYLTSHAAHLLRIPAPFGGLLRLVYETDEWDPITTSASSTGNLFGRRPDLKTDAGVGDKPGGGEHGHGGMDASTRSDEKEGMRRREIELPAVSQRRVGDVVDGGNGRIRVEIWGI